MDPFSRRFTWEVLKKHRPGRVTLLTTHYMDEAEQLTDRLVVMDKGLVVAEGSPLQLIREHLGTLQQRFDDTLTRVQRGEERITRGQQ